MLLLDYQERALERIREGAFLPLRWAPLTLSEDLTVFVAEDALKIVDDESFSAAQADLLAKGYPGVPGGPVPFRLSVTAETAQAICDHLGVLLPTDLILDRLEEAAVVRNEPCLQPADPFMRKKRSPRMDDVPAMLLHSLEVDLRVQQQPGLVLNAGKHWFINAVLARRAKASAFNKGWWSKQAAYRSWRTGKTLWQTGEFEDVRGKAAPHNDKHVDYSQVFQPVKSEGLLRGVEVPLAPLLEDAEYAPLLTYYQPMPWRHPWL